MSTEGTELVPMLERLASNPDVPVDKLERLLAMQERISAKQAETEFAAAMSAAQSEMGRISAESENKQTNTMYASYAQLDRALRPIYTKHGFALSFDEADSPKAEHIRVICHVSHRGGHTRVYHRDMPIVTTGLAGKTNMTATHGNASAQSYGMRYLLKGVFNVAIGEDDNDGNVDQGPSLSTDQVTELNDLLIEVGADKAAFLKYIKSKDLESVPAKWYDRCKELIEAKRRAKK